ncbi:hypothetical protein L596_026537 [Steinernema carpocapsae]|uniref:Uncharacterized protein n=1 Tax=Steinernema carpocapsae TaxID=34508 RepID=A0A4U5M1N8_STECR|nr:hypothetical protein L596_026537 [Steinernema carpocapsae]
MEPIMEAYVDILLQTVKASRRERSKNVEKGRNFDDVDNMLLFPNSLKPEKKATNVTTQFQRTWDCQVRHLITSTDGLIDLKNDGQAHEQSSSRTGNRNAQLNSSTPTLRKFYLAESKETFESIEKKIKDGLLCPEKILEEGPSRFLQAIAETSESIKDHPADQAVPEELMIHSRSGTAETREESERVHKRIPLPF